MFLGKKQISLSLLTIRRIGGNHSESQHLPQLGGYNTDTAVPVPASWVGIVTRSEPTTTTTPWCGIEKWPIKMVMPVNAHCQKPWITPYHQHIQLRSPYVCLQGTCKIVSFGTVPVGKWELGWWLPPPQVNITTETMSTKLCHEILPANYNELQRASKPWMSTEN